MIFQGHMTKSSILVLKTQGRLGLWANALYHHYDEKNAILEQIHKRVFFKEIF